jgi:hypothetical protein
MGEPIRRRSYPACAIKTVPSPCRLSLEIHEKPQYVRCQSLLRFAFDRVKDYDSKQGEMVALLCDCGADHDNFSDAECIALVAAREFHYATSD